MTKLSAVQNKTIEEFWTNLNDYKKQLKFREWELLESKRDDSNNGGGRSNKVSDTTAQKAMILAEDTRYQHLKNIVNTIEQLYKDLDEEAKIIVDMRYWSTSEFFEWEEIADKLYMSRNKVLRKRNILIDETAKRIGWV